jgi:phenol 2-monooxygenase
MKEAATFSSGLGIYYEPDTYLNIDENIAEHITISSVQAGQRAPDVPLQKPATFETTRLQVQTPNLAVFYIALFAGDVARTKSLLATFTKAVSSGSWLFNPDLPIQWLSIFAGPGGPSAFETLGGMPFGRVFYDEDHSAHRRYGVDVEKGAVFVLRPDGWVGTVVHMDDGAPAKLERYFSRFLIGIDGAPGAKL